MRIHPVIVAILVMRAVPVAAQVAIVQAPPEPSVQLTPEALRLRMDTADTNLEKQLQNLGQRTDATSTSFDLRLGEAVKSLTERTDEKAKTLQYNQDQAIDLVRQEIKLTHEGLQSVLDEHAKAIVLARDNAQRALSDALDGQEKRLSGTLATTTQAAEKQQEDAKARADALQAASDRNSALIAALPGRQEIDARGKAYDDRFNDRVRIEDQSLVELRTSLQTVANSIRDIQGEANGRNSLLQIALAIFGAAGIGVAIWAAFHKPAPQVIWANGNGNGYGNGYGNGNGNGYGPQPPGATLQRNS